MVAGTAPFSSTGSTHIADPTRWESELASALRLSTMPIPSLLIRMLQRFLRFLAFVHRKSLRPLCYLFASLRFFRRWISRKCTSSRIATPRHRVCRPPTRPSTLDNDEGTVCGMNVPSHGPFDLREGGGNSPVDMPYRSLSGGHLVPYSPTARGQYTRDHIPWISGSQTSLNEEPGQMGPEPLHVATHSTLRPSSRISVRLHDNDHRQSPDSPTHVSHPPSPSHQTIVFAPETSADNLGPHSTSSGRASLPHIVGSSQELHRSRSPASFVSNSQRSTSRQSQNSRATTGRASYREYRGPPVHPRSPAPSVRHGGYNIYTPSSSTLNGGQVDSNGHIIVPGRLITTPSAIDPSQSGERTVEYVGPRFAPMSTIGVLRYDRSRVRNPAEVDHMIEGMRFGYPETPDIPVGWTAHRHPEGALYFMHAESKTFTEVNVCDEDILEDIGEFKNFLLSELLKETEERGLFMSLNEIQLVLEPQRDEQGVMCRYYFVNPSNRSLFWLDNWDGYEIFKDCLGVLSLPHKGLGIQAHYWWAYLDLHTWSLTYCRSHWDLFPNLCIVTPELKNEVVGMILHAACDHLTSNRSSCPLNSEELKNHLSLVKEIDPHSEEMRRHCAIIIGRIMHMFYNNYFLNFHGEECARLNFDQTIHGWKYYPSFMMSTFAPLLFMTPVNNVRLLHRIFVDDIASKEKWNMFVTKLNGQLQETSVLATVLLNANVAFLPKQSGTGTSPQQIFSYLSLASSMASIIVALVFMGHSRTEARNTPFEAAKFLHGLRHERHGLETLAVAYSLPHALLIWGMVLFFAAFAAQWWVSGNVTSRASVGSVMIVVALLVVWCVWIARERNEYWWFQSDPNQIALEHAEPNLKEDPMSLLGRLGQKIYRGLIMPPWAEQRSASHFTADNHEMQEAQGTRDSLNSVPGPLITVSQPACGPAGAISTLRNDA